jgi:hypothetical protein
MVSRRSLEVLTGALGLAFGLAVIVQSLDVGAGWSTGGVEAGTFPLITGTLVCLGSLVNIGGAIRRPDAPLVGREELRRSAGLLLPALAFVGAIPVVGLYVAAAGYLLGVLHVQHRYSLPRSALIAAGTVLVLYVLFERTFQILMPRGWLGNALGF